MTSTSTHWFEDSGEVSRLVRWMNEHDEYGPLDVERAIDVMEKPWNFSTEYTEMVDAQESELEPLLASSLALARGAKGART